MGDGDLRFNQSRFRFLLKVIWLNQEMLDHGDRKNQKSILMDDVNVLLWN